MKNDRTNFEKLSNFLGNPDQSGLEIFRLIQTYLINKDSTTEEIFQSNIPEYEINHTGFKPIGTWHPIEKNNEILFIRKNQSDSIFWESSRTQIKRIKEPNTNRICFIGESAAAGMFFSPYYTPSIALSNHLNQQTDITWEVIDLTRSCMNAGGLLATCEASLQLSPDFIVVMAGNNWFAEAIFDNDAPITKRQTYSQILENEGPDGIINSYKKNLIKCTEKIMLKLDNLSQQNNIKLIFIVPASNYGHWERKCPIYWQKNGNTSKWYDLYQKASEALEKSNYEEALVLGKQMLAIDNNNAPTSNRIVANSLIALERTDEAYNYCVAESDYAIMHNQLTAFPGTPSFVRKTCKQLGEEFQIPIIDLEEIFIDYLGSKILNDSLFVDYCHMTPDGINIAMAPVAKLLSSYYTKNEKKDSIQSNIDWKKLVKLPSLNNIDPFQLAVSYFYISLYDLHLNQPVNNALNLEKYISLFQKAADYSEKILDVMELYVKARSCYYGAGFSLSKAGQQLFQLVNSPLDFPVAQASPGVDALTIEAICLLLERNSREGIKLMSQYQQHYIRLLDKGVDLTEPLYIERINSIIRLAVDSELSTRRKIPYYKSWWPNSYFSLVADNNNDLELKIVCRIPGENETVDNNLKILVNNFPIGHLRVTNKWNKSLLVIPKSSLIKGFNRLCISWPSLSQDENKEINFLKNRYSMGLKINMFPVFGEVFSLIVSKKVDL